MKVLLVANNKTLIRKFKEAFKDSEYELTVVESTKGAMMRTLQLRFDVIICTGMGKRNRDFSFATDMHGTASKVLVVNDRRIFSAIPFLSDQNLSKEGILEAVERVFEGGD